MDWEGKTAPWGGLLKSLFKVLLSNKQGALSISVMTLASEEATQQLTKIEYSPVEDSMKRLTRLTTNRDRPLGHWAPDTEPDSEIGLRLARL